MIPSPADAITPDQVPSFGKDYAPEASAPDHAEDLKRKRRLFRAYEENKRDEIKEQQLADRYYHSKQWTDEEIRTLARRGQPAITSNRVKRKIDFLVGVEQRMRRDPKAYARNPQDTQTADTITAALRFVCDNVNWPNKASEGTSSGIRRGVGVVYVSIEEKAKGLEVCIKAIDSERFFYDPRSVRLDFSDARYMGVSMWLDIDDAKEQFPGHDFEKYMDKDGGLSTFATEEDRAEQWGDFEHRRVRVVEFWEKKRGGWEYCKFCGDMYLEGGESPYIDAEGESDCPYKAWTPYIDEKGVRYGLVRDMKTIQDEINQRRSKALHEINARQMFITQGSVDDVDDLRRQAAKADGIIEIPPGTTWGQDFGFVDRSKEMKGNVDLLVEAKQEIENIGPSPGLVGQGSGVEAASGRALSMQRDSGMTELQPLFDQNRLWKLQVYRTIWARIKQAWTGERWIRVTDNPEAPQYIGINQIGTDPETGMAYGENMIGEVDVDVILDEGPDTITVQEELFETLSQLGEAAMGPIGRVLIELSNVANKERILELMDEAANPEQDPQQAQAQQEAMELEMRDARAQVALSEAKTLETQAKAAKLHGEMDVGRAKVINETARIRNEEARLPYDIAALEAQTGKTIADAYLAAEAQRNQGNSQGQ